MVSLLQEAYQVLVVSSERVCPLSFFCLDSIFIPSVASAILICEDAFSLSGFKQELVNLGPKRQHNCVLHTEMMTFPVTLQM